MKRPIYDNPSVSPAMDFLTTEGDFDEYDIQKYIARKHQKINNTKNKTTGCSASDDSELVKQVLIAVFAISIVAFVVMLCL